MANINHDVVTYYAGAPAPTTVATATVNHNPYSTVYGITTGGTTYGIAQGGVVYNAPAPQVVQTNHSMPLTFVDFNGTQHHMEVAGELYALMYQYSEYHRSRVKSIPKCLPEPDFDLDEMAQAAELVESLNGNGTKSP